MIETPQVVQIDAQSTAVIHVTIPRAEIQQVMGPGIAELMATVTAQGVIPTGPWFTHHFRMSADTFDFEIGVPVNAPVTPTGRVQMSQLPAATVVRAVYHGPYEQLGDAWGELDAWMSAAGYNPAEDLWERYIVNPETTSDPASWRTELNRPIKS